MKTLVIYDSQFGNTEKIAQEIAKGATKYGEGKALRVSQAPRELLFGTDVVIVGSPTQGGMATQAVRDFLASIPDNGLKGKKAASFDTRFEESNQKLMLRLLMKTIQYASEKILKQLKKKGADAIGANGFFVTDKEGPLKEGELERARVWGESISRIK